MYKNDAGKLMKQFFFCYVITSHRHRFCTYIYYSYTHMCDGHVDAHMGHMYI